MVRWTRGTQEQTRITSHMMQALILVGDNWEEVWIPIIEIKQKIVTKL